MTHKHCVSHNVEPKSGRVCPPLALGKLDRARNNVKYHVNNAIDTVGDALEEAEERWRDSIDDMSGDLKSLLAARTLDLKDISARRRQYVRKLKWSSVISQNSGWFLTAFTWLFGGYVIMAYGRGVTLVHFSAQPEPFLVTAFTGLSRFWVLH